MFHAAPEKMVIFFISAVVLPVPPSEVACPLVSISQKELLTVPSLFSPTRPPTGPSPLTVPVE